MQVEAAEMIDELVTPVKLHQIAPETSKERRLEYQSRLCSSLLIQRESDKREHEWSYSSVLSDEAQLRNEH
ncbi:MAG: hypothetical protein U9N80_08300 [Chloroflexota bacterium]|nr:hypothetical protein [Chloroflexota bacterium]